MDGGRHSTPDHRRRRRSPHHRQQHQHQQHQGNGGGLDMDDPRTPMAWQHRDINYHGHGGRGGGDSFDHRYHDDGGLSGHPGGRHSSSSPSGRNNSYGHGSRGPPTPSSAHSRATRTPDHRRREPRGSSSERFSQHSGRKMSSRDSRDGRNQMGSRNSRSNNQSYSYHNGGGGGGHHRSSSGGAGGYGSRSQPSPSSTEETTEETTETDSQAPPERNDYQRQMYPGYAVPMGYPPQGFPQTHQLMGPIAPPQLIMAPNGSIRSVQSVPMLAAAASAASAPTWDGEPCPVHHHPAMPLAALYGMGGGGAGGAGHHPHHPAISMGPSSVPPSVISGATTVRRARSVAEISNGGFPLSGGPPGTPHLDHKSFHGSMHHIAMPNGTMRTMIAAPTRVVLTENGAPSTLPMRDPKNRSPLPPKNSEKDSGSVDCCSGHFVVVWIILGIVTFGILLGIILKFTIA